MSTWDKLSMAERAEVMKLAVENGIYDLGTIRDGYNEFAKGGEIHIKPENRGKFTALKKRTGHSATWFKQHGTPAQKKMATFALNARKWKHGLGGNLFLTGGPTQDNDPATKDWEHRREHEELHPMYQRTQKDEEYWREKQARNAQATEELDRKKGVVMSALERQASDTPFTGESYKQAVDDQRQRALDKAKDFEKGARAVVTAAELGLSGASLLGAYANWKNWANAASLTKRGIANLLQKAQAPMQEAGALIDGYQTMDALGNNEFDAYYNGASGVLGVAGTIGASDIFRGRYPMVDRFLDTSGIIQNAGDFIKFGYDALHNNIE